MAYTIFQVIKALPLAFDIQEKLIKDYPSMSDEKKSEVSRTAWLAFDQLRKHVEALCQERIMKEIANGTRSADADLGMVLAEEVEKELQIYTSGKHQDDDRLASLRKELEKYIQTM